MEMTTNNSIKKLTFAGSFPISAKFSILANLFYVFIERGKCRKTKYKQVSVDGALSELHKM